MNRRRVSPGRQGDRQPEIVELERAKRGSVGQLLFKCARLFNERAIQRVNAEADYPLLRPAHTNLFPHIDFAGTRLVELARRLGVTKQAVGQTVAELEQLGMLETIEDASDARAKLVRFTSKGKSAIAHGLSILVDIEKELEPRIGSDNMVALHRALIALESVLTADGLTGTPTKTPATSTASTARKTKKNAAPERKQ